MVTSKFSITQRDVDHVVSQTEYTVLGYLSDHSSLKLQRLTLTDPKSGRAINPDLVIAKEQIAIEIDGVSHTHKEQQDTERNSWLWEHGWKTIRLRQSGQELLSSHDVQMKRSMPTQHEMQALLESINQVLLNPSDYTPSLKRVHESLSEADALIQEIKSKEVEWIQTIGFEASEKVRKEIGELKFSLRDLHNRDAPWIDYPTAVSLEHPDDVAVMRHTKYNQKMFLLGELGEVTMNELSGEQYVSYRSRFVPSVHRKFSERTRRDEDKGFRLSINRIPGHWVCIRDLLSDTGVDLRFAPLDMPVYLDFNHSIDAALEANRKITKHCLMHHEVRAMSETESARYLKIR